MKLRRLTIHNIASIEDATIDFTLEPLKSEPLFLIKGATGAGKSTILDAICLALYAKTPRLVGAEKEDYATGADEEGRPTETIKGNSNQQLLRRNAGEALARLEFKGNDGVRYTAEWSVKRARGRADGAIQRERRLLTNEETHQSWGKTAEIDEKMMEVVGLSFQQFCRTSMLAQGEFTRFLYSKSKEKAEILEKLTGTERFAKIGQTIFVMCGEQRERRDRQQEKVNLITIMPEEERAETERLKNEAEGKKREVDQEKRTLETRATWLKNYEDTLKRLTEKEADYVKVKQQMDDPARKQEAQTAADYHKAAQARAAKAAWAKEQEVMAKLKGKSAAYKAQYLNLRGKLMTMETTIDELRSTLPTLEKAAADAKTKRDNAQLAANEKSREVDKLKEERDKMEPEKLKQADKQLAQLIDQSKEANTAVTLYGERMATCKQAQERVDKLQAVINADKAERKKMEPQRAEAQTLYDAKKAIYDKIHLSVEDAAKEVRSRVEVGDVCPVCGQKIMEMMHDDDFESILKKPRFEMEAAEKDLNAILISIQAKDVQIRKAETVDMRQNRSELAKSMTAMERQKEEMAKQCGAVDGFDPEQLEQPDTKTIIAHLDALKTGFEKERNRLAEQLELVAERTKRIEEEQAALAKLNKGVQAAAEEYNEAMKRHDNCQTTMTKGRETLASCGTVEAELNDMLKGWKDEEIKAVALADGEKLADAWTTYSTKIVQWRSDIRNAKATIDEQQHVLSDFYKAHGDIDETRLGELCGYSDEQIYQIEKRHRETLDRRAGLEGAIETLKKQKDEAEKQRPTSEEPCTVEQLVGMAKEKEQQSNDLAREITEKDIRLKNDKVNQERRREEERLLAKMTEETTKWENFNTMLGDREGNKFRQIAQSFILGHLLKLANQYLDQFTERFTLTCNPGSLVILIEDKFEGATAFGPNTLSGGESFMVSLSLALGLSQLNATQNAVDTLFIDEGFGTLDEDYLSSVMGTLERLHQMGGRRVGIISHVDSLAQSINTQVRVQKVDRTKSTVTVYPSPTVDRPHHS